MSERERSESQPPEPSEEERAASVVEAVAAAAEAQGAGGEAEEGGSEPGTVSVRFFGRTDVGLVREHNEDNFLVSCLDEARRFPPMEEVIACEVGPRGVVFAVCDGMGGANAGEVASQMAVDTLHEVMSGWEAPADRDVFAHRLVKAVEAAGERIFSAAKMDSELRGMGTTATVAGLIDEVLFVGQVGDSRAYVLREGRLGLLTKDQSLVNQLIEAGQLSEEDAESFELGNIILQALGTTETVSVDLSFLSLRRGDRLMLSSDGLTGLVHDEVIRDVLQEVEDPRACCERLVEMANAGGGHDNITVIVVDFDGEGLEPPDSEARPGYYQYPLPVMEDPTPIRKLSRREPSRKLAEERLPLVSGGERGAPSRETRSGGDVSSAEGRRGRRGLVVAALGVLALGGVVVLRSGSEGPSAGGASEREASSASVASPRAAEPVPSATPPELEVTVRLDFSNAELFVDGRSFGHARDRVARLRLPPGIYRIEARVEGRPLASRQIQVVRGRALDVALTAPRGVAAVDGGREGGQGVDAGGAADAVARVDATVRPGKDSGRPVPRSPAGEASRRREASDGSERVRGTTRSRSARDGGAAERERPRRRAREGASEAERAEPQGSGQVDVPENPF